MQLHAYSLKRKLKVVLVLRAQSHLIASQAMVRVLHRRQIVLLQATRT
jgi:hypothetical protein